MGKMLRRITRPETRAHRNRFRGWHLAGRRPYSDVLREKQARVEAVQRAREEQLERLARGEL